MKIFLKFYVAMALAALLSCSKKDINLNAPESLVASDNFSLKVKLAWDAVAGANEYQIYRAEGDDDPATLEFKEIGNSETNHYVDVDVVSGSYYYYKVIAVNGGSKSGMSDAVEGSTTNITPDEAFDLLAELTEGKSYRAASATQVPSVIIKVIQENAKEGADVVFLIDNTSSMLDDIDAVKKSLNTIISKLPSKIKLSSATYNDDNVDPGHWYAWKDFTTQYNTIKSFINGIAAYGGGDDPESVYDGLYETLKKMSWSATNKRMIIVVGDAPPLEADLTDHKLTEIVKMCSSMKVAANLYPILIKD